MGSNEKFCLRWNDFETNISAAFRELRDDKDFFDVTIACDDSQLQAHKVILSACSPFFRNILRKNPHQHPLLYLKGVKFKELVSVLNFMYMGEVNVAQEELNSFLSVAEELRVKGLTQNSSDSAKPSDHHKSNSRSREPPDSELANSGPPQKKFRPSGSTSGGVSQPLSATTTGSVSRPSAQHHSQHHSHQQPNNTVPGHDDDIQEVVPVKSEPRDTTVQSLGHQQQPVALSRDDSQNYPEVGQPGTVALQENYQEDAYDYESFEGYDDGSYDQTTGQSAGQDGNKGRRLPSKSVNMTLPPSLRVSASLPPPLTLQSLPASRPKGTGNILIKEELDLEPGYINASDPGNDAADADNENEACDVRWDVEVESRISLDLNLFVCMACSGSKYSSKQKLNVISHIRAKHLTDFAGFLCELCPQVFNSSGRFERHMKISHNVLTVSADAIKTEDSIVE